MYTLRVKTTTILKQSTNQAINLSPFDRYTLPGSALLPIAAYQVAGDHLKVTFGKDESGIQVAFNGRNTWYVYAAHVELLNSGKPIKPHTPSQNLMGSLMLFTPTADIDEFGATLYKLALVVNGKEVSHVKAVSGQPGKKPVRLKQDVSGSMRPCPEGKYQLGGVAEGWWGDGLGRYWIPVIGTEPYRRAIGIHPDQNRYKGFPGSAGCICPLDEKSTVRVCAWRDDGVDTLICDYGLGTF